MHHAALSPFPAPSLVPALIVPTPRTSSSRPCPLSRQYRITALPSRRSLLACTATKEGKAEGRDGKPSWVRLWTSSQDAQSKEVSQPSPPRSGPLNSGSSRPPPLPSRQRNRSADSTDAPNRAGGQGAWSAEEATPPSTPSQRGRTINSRPPRSSRGQADNTRQSSASTDAPRSRPPRSFRGQGTITRQSNARTDTPTQGVVPSHAQQKRKRAHSFSDAQDSPLLLSSKRHRQDTGSKPGRQSKSAPQNLGSLLLDARTASTPVDCYRIVWQLGKRVQHDQQTRQQHSTAQLHEIEVAADALAAMLLGSSTGSSGSSSSSSRSSSSRGSMQAAPFQQLNSMQLSLTIWGFTYVVNSNSRSRQVDQLIDCVASFAAQSSIMDRAGNNGCMHWARLLYSTAKLGIKCQDSQPGQQLFDVAAQKFPQMLHQQLPCTFQSISNTFWAFATAEYPGSLHGLVAEVASNGAQAMNTADSQGWSDTLWALGTMADRCVDLGERGSVDAIMGAGAASMAHISRSDVQHYSKSLWGLVKAGYRPHDSITSRLADAVSERSSDASPQNLSNTLWALSELFWYDAHQIPVMVAALVHHESSTPVGSAQHCSNALQALGEMRWYDAGLYCQLVGGVLHKICDDAPEAVGQHFSNSMFSCALSCHFDSSVDTLAEWGSQQSLGDWTEQALSNVLYAWAVLSATAGGDTASMQKLAQHLFAEARSRGVADFLACSDWRHHMGKLCSAHQEALHVQLPRDGVSDGELLQAARSERARVIDVVSKQQSQFMSTMSAALHGVYEVRTSMVEGYHALIVHHPNCPRGIAIAVTHPQRDYMRCPSGQLYGKTALRLEQMKRGCDGVVLCDEIELQGKSVEQQRALLVQRIEQAAQS